MSKQEVDAIVARVSAAMTPTWKVEKMTDRERILESENEALRAELAALRPSVSDVLCAYCRKPIRLVNHDWRGKDWASYCQIGDQRHEPEQDAPTVFGHGYITITPNDPADAPKAEAAEKAVNKIAEILKATQRAKMVRK